MNPNIVWLLAKVIFWCGSLSLGSLASFCLFYSFIKPELAAYSLAGFPAAMAWLYASQLPKK